MPREEDIDITDLLFHCEFAHEEEPEELEINLEVYGRASEEATRLVGTSSPMELLRKTEELYKMYIQESN